MYLEVNLSVQPAKYLKVKAVAATSYFLAIEKGFP
jgi:hypothetical protein